VRLFLAGDVMSGRGIDQILERPCDPALGEPYMDSALGYVALAERANGPIPRRAPPGYVWGDALEELEREAPAARIANLETAVTWSDERAPKGINYRMSPANAGCLAAARLDCCTLANNHVLDWGAAGLAETLRTLQAAGIRTAGAGRDLEQAQAPAVLDGRVLVFSYCAETSGVPRSWAAGPGRAGVALLEDLSQRELERIAARVNGARRPGERVVVSLHWGPNWGYRITEEEQRFARGLVEAGADIVHGHSSHHPKAIEVFRGKLILYGCGDLINDYEGIAGYGEFRGELGLMYFARLDPGSGSLAALDMSVMRMRRFRACRAEAADARWLAERLSRESVPFGCAIEWRADWRLHLRF
jgi:poly-gamma-glutamate synthesis protein (capsule biosynthesis protein)